MAMAGVALRSGFAVITVGWPISWSGCCCAGWCMQPCRHGWLTCLHRKPDHTPAVAASLAGSGSVLDCVRHQQASTACRLCCGSSHLCMICLLHLSCQTFIESLHPWLLTWRGFAHHSTWQTWMQRLQPLMCEALKGTLKPLGGKSPCACQHHSQIPHQAQRDL